MSSSSYAAADGKRSPVDHHPHSATPSDIAVGVIIGRTSEFFDFFVFAIASVIVFPDLVFPFLDPVQGTLASFLLVLLAFVARPVGTVLFMALDRSVGRVAKLTAALFLMGTATVAMGLLPSYDYAGVWAIVILAALRIGQGLALGGVWDGMPSLLAIVAPKHRRGIYAMVPQLGAPFGLIVASLLFAYLVATLPKADFMSWGWRYPFFVAFAVNVVALFARLRIVASEEFTRLFESRELQATTISTTLRQDGATVVLGIFVPLASFAMFHMVTVYPLSWIFLYSDQDPTGFLLIQSVAACFGIVAMLLSGWLADVVGRQKLLLWGAVLIGLFAIAAPLLLSGGKTGQTVFMMLGFAILGLNFGQSSGAVASLFGARNRYTGSAIVSDLAWLFGAGFAPLTGLLLSEWLGLPAAGLYLLSGAICSVIAIWYAGRLEFRISSRPGRR